MVEVERGPFVYGVEGSDCQVPLDSPTLSNDATFEVELVTIDSTTFVALNLSLENGRKAQFIPYFVLGNRVPGEYFRV